MDRGADCELVVAGGDKGGRLDVLDAILRTRLTGRVHLVGHVGDDDLTALYSAAKALVFPSLYEGFGLPALEAMASGTPVIASNTTGLAEAVGDAGLTIDPRDAEDLAEAMRRVLNDEALRERLVAAGFARAAEFTWARTAAATAGVYREALA
jgi:glycosyltransferase involved in cell wall biosynthesis